LGIDGEFSVEFPSWARVGEAFDDRKNLHVFAFDVGEGNCIILRCGNDTVIIDAGAGNSPFFDVGSYILPKIISLIRGTNLKAIFVTHPHGDHYSLIKSLVSEVGYATQPPEVYLGGTEASWKSFGPDILSSLGGLHITFVTDRNSVNNEHIPDFLQNTEFSFVLPKVYKCTGNPNQCSFFLRIDHNYNAKCSFLFTGDAYKSNFDGIIGAVHNSAHARLLHNAIDPKYRTSFTLQRDTEPDEFFKRNRRMLQGVGVLFHPHHGSDSNGSQDIPSYLLGLKNPPAACVISSFVERSDHNPPGSSIRMVPKNVAHPLHTVTFWRGGKRGDSTASKDFKFTDRRIYVTEAAPGGAYWFRSTGDDIELFNAYKNSFAGRDGECHIGFCSIFRDYTDFNAEISRRNAQIIDDD
jgi:hypothetical protein